MFVDQEQELEKSSGSAHNMQRAKEVYQTGGALMSRFRSAEVELAVSLRCIAERSIRIDGEKAYHEIELLVNGPGPAVDRASRTLEITVTPMGLPRKKSAANLKFARLQLRRLRSNPGRLPAFMTGEGTWCSQSQQKAPRTARPWASSAPPRRACKRAKVS